MASSAFWEHEILASFLEFPSPAKDLLSTVQTMVKTGIWSGPLTEVILYSGALGDRGNMLWSLVTAGEFPTFLESLKICSVLDIFRIFFVFFTYNHPYNRFLY